MGKVAFRLVVYFSGESEIFVRREEIDQEPFVEERTHLLLPLIVSGYFLAVDSHLPGGGFNQVEDQAEKSGLARSVITHQPKALAIADADRRNIQYGHPVIYLF